jgi:hypothetical protein
MSLESIIGAGYSGYGIVSGIPLLMLSTNGPENENLLRSTGAYHSDPAKSTGQLPAKQRRSLSLNIQTLVTPRIWKLVKRLTYGWRNLNAMDSLSEVPFEYVAGAGEGYRGTCYVDNLSLNTDATSFLVMSLQLTSWVWTDLSTSTAPDKIGKRLLNPQDPLYKPISGWQTIPYNSCLSAESIVQGWSLEFNNNWTYQTFSGGYLEPPNPALITAGNLDTVLVMTWMARRQDRPGESGTVRIQIGVAPNIIDTLYIDQVIREPSRQLNNSGDPDTVIQWQASFFVKGKIPYSN